MSEEVERRLVEVLNNPTTSPYGNPIPGLDQLGVGQRPLAPEDLVRLSELPAGEPTAVVVRRLAEHVQSDPDLIARLRDAGIVPDARVTVTLDANGEATISASGHEDIELSPEMCHAVQVKTA